MNLRDASGVLRGLGGGQGGRALDIRGQNRVDQRGGPRRRVLGDSADTDAFRDHNIAAVQGRGSHDQAQKRRLTRAVPADEADPLALIDDGGCPVEEQTAFNPLGYFFDVQHDRRGDSTPEEGGERLSYVAELSWLRTLGRRPRVAGLFRPPVRRSSYCGSAYCGGRARQL